MDRRTGGWGHEDRREGQKFCPEFPSGVFVGCLVLVGSIQSCLYAGAFPEHGAQPLPLQTPPLRHRKAFTLIKEQSKFVDWQRIKVQENSEEVNRDLGS